MESRECTCVPWTLWGSHPRCVGGTPIKIMAGTLPECETARRQRVVEGWELVIGRTGARRPWFSVDDAQLPLEWS